MIISAAIFPQGPEDQDMPVIKDGAEVLGPMPPVGSYGFKNAVRRGIVVDPAQNRDTQKRLVVTEKLGGGAKICRVGIIDSEEELEKALFSSLTQQDVFLLFFIFQHGFDCQPRHHGDFPDMRGASRDTDDTLFFSVYNDRHVDAGQNAGVEFVIIYDNNVFFAPDDPVRRLVIGPYAVFAAACDDEVRKADPTLEVFPVGMYMRQTYLDKKV